MSTAKLAQQINTVKTLLGIKYGPSDGHLDQVLTDRLATFLDGIGAQDMRDITDLQSVAAFIGGDVGGFEEFINLRTGQQVDFNAITMDDNHVRWRMQPQFTKDGFPVFLWKPYEISSGGFFSGLLETAGPSLPIAMIALSLLVPGIGTALGQMILGPTLSAAVPGLAGVIGNTAINTALNGGNIEGALKGSVLSFAGANLGDFAGGLTLDATGSDLVSAVASRVTSAYITGGDPTKALAGALAQQGAQSMYDFFSDTTEAPAVDYESFDTVDPGAALDASALETVNMETLNFSDAGYSAQSGTDYSGGVFTDTNPAEGWEAPIPTDVEPGTYDIPPETPTMPSGELVFDDWAGSVSPAPTTSSTNSGSVSSGIDTLTDLAIGALKVYQTWQRTGKQSIVTPGVRTTSTGSVIAPRKDGMLVTTTTQGRVSTARMEVGKPYLFADGSLVTNNGDGSYTTISANGTATTSRYPASSSLFGSSGLSGDNTLLYAGLGVVALVLLTNRR